MDRVWYLLRDGDWMGLIDRLGLKIRGNYCFYVIKPDTAVVVGVRRKKNPAPPIPKKIGKYTVRGIHLIYESPQYKAAFPHLTDKQKEALVKKLEPFHQPVFGSLEQLPDTVEYVGYHLDTGNTSRSIPSHIRYIESLTVGGESLALPRDLLYLGQIKNTFGNHLRRLRFHGFKTDVRPVLPLSAYLGTESESIPPITDDALSYCRVESLYYPGDIHEEIHSQIFRLRSIDRLVIDDLTGLEEYTTLVRQGNAPPRHPGACLYHLLRAAKNIQINVQMDRIPDGMFKECTQLSSLGFQRRSSANYAELSPEITAIGAEAFQNCKSIKHITTGQLIQSIGDRAFMGCDIIHFGVYGLVRNIGREAFCQCASLRTLRLYSKNITIGEDAFLGCNKLELSPADRDRIAGTPCFPSYLAVEEKRDTKVTELLKSGDQYLRHKPVTLSAKKSAFNCYCSALQQDHHRMEIMNKIEALLLDYQVPLRIEANRLSIIKSSLREHQSTAMLAALESTLRSLDDTSVILCAAGDIPSVVLAFAINHNPEAASLLCEFFCDLLKQHAQVSATARSTVHGIMNALLTYCTQQSPQPRNTRVRQECSAQKQRGVVTERRYDLDLQADGAVEKVLTTGHFRTLYDKAAEQSAANDAALWADIVNRLDPRQKLPKVKARPQPKKTVSTPSPPKAVFQNIPVWTPWIPEPEISIPSSKPVRYIGDETEEEFNRRTSELISEYNAEQEAARIAREIEDSMLSPPGTYGGY